MSHSFKPSKIDPKKHKILFLSDAHINHEPSWNPKLYQSRGFASNQDFYSWFLAKWHEEVDCNTIVIDLGDSHFSDSKGDLFNYYSLLPCNIHIYVWGNHLSGSKQVYQNAVKEQYNLDIEVYPIRANNTVFVGNYYHVYIEGISVYCQHYASYIWPELSKGGYHLAGHSHSSCKELNVNGGSQGRVLDIGVDNAIKYRNSPFFRWEDVKSILNAREVVKKDRH